MDPKTLKRDSGEFKLSFWNYVVIACKGVFGDGFVSIVEYLLQLFNEKVLGKCDPETLKKWSQVFAALADFIERMLSIFMSEGAVLDAAKATIKAVRDLAQHLSDGKYDADELDEDIEAVRSAVEAWRKARKAKSRA